MATCERRAHAATAERAPPGLESTPRCRGGPTYLRRLRQRRALTREITRRLNADGVPTPTGKQAVWGTSTIGRLLRNEAYCRPRCLAQQYHRPRPGMTLSVTVENCAVLPVEKCAV
jgi:hypothetical protein